MLIRYVTPGVLQRGRPSGHEERRAQVASSPHGHGPPVGAWKVGTSGVRGVQARAGETNRPGPRYDCPTDQYPIGRSAASSSLKYIRSDQIYIKITHIYRPSLGTIGLIVKHILTIYLFNIININIFTYIFCQTLVTLTENASKIVFFLGLRQ